MMMMPMGACCEFLAHQNSAVVVPHDLPVVHGVAGADRPPRKVDRASLVGRPIMRMGAPVLRARGVMMCRAGVIASRASVMARAA
jgi:hypothetical protein